MTVSEIFGKISAHMVEGMMFHEQMADYYDFLGFEGYSCCHKWHYICETMSRSCVHEFYIEHYNKLLMDGKVDSGSIIPTNWNNVSRFDVDISVRKNAVKAGITEWLSWERKTHDLYLSMHKELMTLNESTAAHKVADLIADVEDEIHAAEKKFLELSAVGYDMTYILDQQRHIIEKYGCKREKVKKHVKGGA